VIVAAAVEQELQSQERAGKQILLAAAKLGVKIIQVHYACTAELLTTVISQNSYEQKQQ
jgi:hypothetical protein